MTTFCPVRRQKRCDVPTSGNVEWVGVSESIAVAGELVLGTVCASVWGLKGAPVHVQVIASPECGLMTALTSTFEQRVAILTDVPSPLFKETEVNVETAFA
jgi:hypothetical protein